MKNATIVLLSFFLLGIVGPTYAKCKNMTTCKTTGCHSHNPTFSQSRCDKVCEAKCT